MKKGLCGLCLCPLAFLFFMTAAVAAERVQEEETVQSLLPQLDGWRLTEEPLYYVPENLFEYINGAAEIYLSYDFEKLAVGQYGQERSSADMSVEIYDMGSVENAFGIYSAERFPDSRFIDTGLQGYIEGETLNFLVGRYYVKLLCFDCPDEAETLRSFTRNIVSRVENKGRLPRPLEIFPEEGLVKNSEKFVLTNFMGYGFLHNGFLATYQVDGKEFDAFVIEGENEEDAENMLNLYLEAKQDAGPEKTDYGYHFEDRYYKNTFLNRSGRYIYGVMKIEESDEKTGIDYVKKLAVNLRSSS